MLRDLFAAGRSSTPSPTWPAWRPCGTAFDHPLLYADVNVQGSASTCSTPPAWPGTSPPCVLASPPAACTAGTRPSRSRRPAAADHPLAPYPASKRAMELFAHSYAHLYGLPITTVRFFNVYGPHGRPDMMPWQWTLEHPGRQAAHPLRRPATSAATGRTSTTSSPGSSLALDKRLANEVLNLGCGSPVANLAFVNILERLLGKEVGHHRRRRADAGQRAADHLRRREQGEGAARLRAEGAGGRGAAAVHRVDAGGADHMRRLWSFIAITAAITSGVVAAASVALHIRSAYVADEVWFSSDSGCRIIVVDWSRGSLAAVFLLSPCNVRFSEEMPRFRTIKHRRPFELTAVMDQARLGELGWRVSYAIGNNGLARSGRSFYVQLPLPVVAAAAALPLTWFVLVRVGRSKRRPGRCVRCGYDLRATPGRCPECGAAAVAERPI